MFKWYVAKTKSSNMAEEELKKQEFEVYTPFIERSRIEKGGRVVLGKELLFGPYVFVRLDLAGSARWRAVNGTRGVERLLPTHCEIPLALPDGYVGDLQRRAAEGEFTLAKAIEVTLGYMPGDYVPIASGPWGGYGGILLNERPKRQKGKDGTTTFLPLLISLLGRQTRVYIPNYCVDPAASSASAVR